MVQQIKCILIIADTNDFISQSGWFTYPGLALGKTAQLHVFASKANMSYEELLNTKQAVYCFKYKEEKVGGCLN